MTGDLDGVSASSTDFAVVRARDRRIDARFLGYWCAVGLGSRASSRRARAARTFDLNARPLREMPVPVPSLARAACHRRLPRRGDGTDRRARRERERRQIELSTSDRLADRRALATRLGGDVASRARRRRLLPSVTDGAGDRRHWRRGPDEPV